MFLEIHTLVDRGLCCLCRDGDNKMKVGKVAGVERARQSSANVKRAVNELYQQDFMTKWGEKPATRTCELPSELLKKLTAAGKNKQDSITAINAIFSSMKLTLKEKDEKKQSEDKEVSGQQKRKEQRRAEKLQAQEIAPTSALLYVTQEEIDALTQLALENFTQLASEKPDKDLAGKLKQLVSKKCKSTQVALMGRFIAEIDDMYIEGAVEVAHAFSCNELSLEREFFTAIDDIAKVSRTNPDDRTEIGSNLMYQNGVINIITLANNLGVSEHDPLVAKVCCAFAECFIRATPKAKRTSTAEHSLPDFVRVIISKSPLSLHSAFAIPVRPGNGSDCQMAQAERALLRRSANLAKVYGKDAKFDLLFETEGYLDEQKPLLEAAGTKKVENMRVMLDQLNKALL